MPTADMPECTCPLIDISRFGPRGGVEPAFLRGDPRGSGCPIHETEAMREERRRAEHLARYGDLDDFKATGGLIKPGGSYLIGEYGPEPLVMPETDWSKIKLDVRIIRVWGPIAVELLEDLAPEYAAQFADHRGPEHQFALLHAGTLLDAVAWRCATCNTGGDLP